MHNPCSHSLGAQHCLILYFSARTSFQAVQRDGTHISNTYKSCPNIWVNSFNILSS